MKKNKGFTLIELLAIIVILAIIAVITVPIILNIIENSKKGAATDSAYGYKDAVNKWYVEKLSLDHNFNLSSSYTIEDGKIIDDSVQNDAGVLIPFTGEKPTNGYLNYTNNVLTTGCLTFGDYKVTFANGEVTSTVKGNCNETTSVTCGADEYMVQEYVVTDYDACTALFLTEMAADDEMATTLCTGAPLADSGNLTLNELIAFGAIPYEYVSDFVELADANWCRPNSERCFDTIDNGDGTGSIIRYTCGGHWDDATSAYVIPEGSILDVNIPSHVTTKTGSLTVTTINEGAFRGSRITSATIPNSVTTIGSNAFNNNNITSIEIPNGVTTIGFGAFYANNLETVVLPESVTTIENNAFKKQKDVPQQADSNTNLTTIYNNTGREFNWNQVTGGSSSDSTFETGTITHSQGNITVTTGYPE